MRFYSILFFKFTLIKDNPCSRFNEKHILISYPMCCTLVFGVGKFVCTAIFFHITNLL